MPSITDSRSTWTRGTYLLCLVPVVGLLLTLTDPPLWLQIPGLLLMLALVGVGVAMISRRQGGWRPSDTLTPPEEDGDDR